MKNKKFQYELLTQSWKIKSFILNYWLDKQTFIFQLLSYYLKLKNQKFYFQLLILKVKNSLFQEKMSACAAINTCYIMDVCNCVQSIIFLPPMMRTSFVLVALTRLIVNEPKHWVTYSHRTDNNILRGGKESNTLVFLLSHIILAHF